MRKLIVVLCVCLFLTGCGTRYNERENTSDDLGYGYFTVIQSWGEFSDYWYIVYANDTKVKYLIKWDGYHYAITPLYNSDGSLQIYNKEE